jgi:hypothetical protein
MTQKSSPPTRQRRNQATRHGQIITLADVPSRRADPKAGQACGAAAGRLNP